MISDQQTILLWEDDYLMIEIMPRLNLDFAKKESERINNFGKEHFDGKGFTQITEIKKKTKEIVELKIPTEQFTKIFDELGIEKYSKLQYYGGGEPTAIKSPRTIAYGKLKSAIFIEQENELVTNVWFISYNWKDALMTKLNTALNQIGSKHDLIMVDWFKGEIIDLLDQSAIDNYFNRP